MYKKNDVVIINSPAGVGIPHVHVKLVERVEVKPSKGRSFDWPGYIGWQCELIKEDEVEALRKEWNIPFRWPDRVSTFTFEKNIVKKAKLVSGPNRRRITRK